MVVYVLGLPWWLSGKEPANAGDVGSFPTLRRSPGGVLGSPVQNSRLEEVLGKMAKGQKYPSLVCLGRKTSPAFGYARCQDLIINIKDVA